MIVTNVESAALITKVENFVFSYARNKNSNKKERPVCSSYGLVGHVVDKCYKLHGYPPGYKAKVQGKGPSANQVSGQSAFVESIPFSQEQCQQLLALINTHSILDATTSGSTLQATRIMKNPQQLSGPYQMEDDWDG
ncbi:hypothetical protein F0562_034495 [Nyssa sinensis]|uniref:Uncharacterized protein n=1 Tax=Nyssa sinensis TaxID=561372 RepID=A0A5J5ALE6_9ASTE|nr:hypothetical protein F0562_034495 [Nyssa sinensis]